MKQRRKIQTRRLLLLNAVALLGFLTLLTLVLWLTGLLGSVLAFIF